MREAAGMALRGRPVFGIGLMIIMVLSTYGNGPLPVTFATPLPGQTPFVMRVTDSSEYTDSGLVQRNGQSWVATAVRSPIDGGVTTRIYHWTGSRWSLRADFGDGYGCVGFAMKPVLLIFCLPLGATSRAQ